MKELEIKLPRKGYLPGEIVSGKVVLKSDLNFTCKKAVINIVGHMIHTYMKTTSKGKRGVSSEVRERTWGLLEATSELAEDVEMYIGKSEFPFQFQLPEDLRPSYSTSTLGIVYHLYATLEVSKKEVLNATSEVTIFHSIAETPDEPIEESAPQGFTEKSLIVKMDSHRLCIGESILFSYLINTDMKFKALRAEIEHTEQFAKVTTRILLKREIPSDELTRHEWKMLSIFSERPIPPSVSSEELQSSLVLKVTFVRKLNIDQTIRIPLVAGHCLKPGWNEEREDVAIRHPPRAMIPPVTPEPVKEVTASDEEQFTTDEERVAQNWYKRALTFRDDGEIDEAIRSIETAIKWHPDFEDALALMAELKQHKETG